MCRLERGHLMAPMHTNQDRAHRGFLRMMHSNQHEFNEAAPQSKASLGRKTRVAIVVSHPIQHFAPLYRALAKRPELTLKVFFCSRIGVMPYFDPGFGVEFRWDADLLSGYASAFLARSEQVKSVDFWSVYSPDLESRLDEFCPDVVQVYGYAHRLALQAIYWCNRRNIPVLQMSDSELVHFRNRVAQAAKRVFLPRLYKRINAFLTIGDNNEAYLRYYGVDPIKMFRSPLTTDEALFRSALEDRAAIRSRTRQALSIGDASFVALFVGKLIARKRPADLIEAVRLARQRSGMDIVALLVGHGALRDTLESSLSKSDRDFVRFAGFVNQGELPSMYAAADVIAHPAEKDPHPIAVTEGVIMGLPAIVSDRVGSAGPSDTVRLHRNGLIFKIGDVPAFSSALELLAGHSALREQMGLASRQIAEEMGLEASVQGYLQAVSAVLR